jgi:hypothetical protein
VSVTVDAIAVDVELRPSMALVTGGEHDPDPGRGMTRSQSVAPTVNRACPTGCRAHSPARFAIIDDEPDMGPLAPHHVRTRMLTGFDAEAAGAAHALLAP